MTPPVYHRRADRAVAAQSGVNPVGPVSLTTDHRIAWAKPAPPEPTGLSPSVPHRDRGLFEAIPPL